MPYRRLLLYGLMAVLTAAAAYAGWRFAGLVGAEIGAVCGIAVSAVSDVGKRRLDERETRRRDQKLIFLPTSTDDTPPADPSPASLLTAERALVPFIGRDAELKSLVDWCTRPTDGPLRLLTGPSGTGKTRLARQLSTRLPGWNCLWVREEHEANAVKAARQRKTLIIVDYAEARPRENLHDLIWQLAWPDDKPGRPSLIVAKGVTGQGDNPVKELRKRRIRVLFLARANGDWWNELRERAETWRERYILRQADPIELSPIGVHDEAFEKHYDSAVSSVCDQLGVEGRSFPAPVFTTSLPILVIHTAALIAVLDAGGIQPRLLREVMERLLEHEERYWLWSSEASQLSWLGSDARRQSVAELCLTGADSLADIAEVLKRVPDLSEKDVGQRRDVARWLGSLYPAEKRNLVSSLQPHLLSEHLVVRELNDDPSFAASTLSDLPDRFALHTMRLLGFASYYDESAPQIILNMLDQAPDEMLIPAIRAAVDTGVAIDNQLNEKLLVADKSVAELAAISAAMPLRAPSLQRTAATVRRRFTVVGKLWLRQTRAAPADKAEIMLRQKILLELSRVSQVSQRQPNNEVPAERDILAALRRQRKALSGVGEREAMDMVIEAIKQIESPKSPDPEEVS
jgi:hypothetical protein